MGRKEANRDSEAMANSCLRDMTATHHASFYADTVRLKEACLPGNSPTVDQTAFRSIRQNDTSSYDFVRLVNVPSRE